jgi:hypothetical protein
VDPGHGYGTSRPLLVAFAAPNYQDHLQATRSQKILDQICVENLVQEHVLMAELL